MELAMIKLIEKTMMKMLGQVDGIGNDQAHSPSR
jgi:hypothetical protein